MLGTDAELNVQSDFAAYGTSLEGLRDAFAATGAKAVFLIFDACRNRPQVGGNKAGTKGIGRIEAGADMLIAYSTDLNDLAQEGVYAPILAEELMRPGQIAVAAFSETQRRVAETTGADQKPWFDQRLYQKICFAGCDSVVAPVAAEETEYGPSLVKGEGDCADMTATLVFPFDRTSPTLESVSVLEEAMRIALECKVESISIEAHEDKGHASAAYAQGISERRASTVVSILAAQGFDSMLISRSAFGETRPLKPGKRSPANRRAEVAFDLNGAAAKSCRLPAHGVESWGFTQTVERESSWRGGGGDQTKYCNELKGVLQSEFPEATEFEVLDQGERQESTCAPLNCPRYKYRCRIEVRGKPVYKEAVSENCR